MDDLLKNSIKSLEIQAEGRRSKRVPRESVVTLSFGNNTVSGTLVNISVTGFLAAFPVAGPLPILGGKVTASIEADGKEQAVNVEGNVVRVQVPQDYEHRDAVEIAVDFLDHTSAGKKEIRTLIKHLDGIEKLYKS